MIALPFVIGRALVRGHLRQALLALLFCPLQIAQPRYHLLFRIGRGLLRPAGFVPVLALRRPAAVIVAAPVFHRHLPARLPRGLRHRPALGHQMPLPVDAPQGNDTGRDEGGRGDLFTGHARAPASRQA